MLLTPEDLHRIAARTLAHYDKQARAYWEGTRDHDGSQTAAAHDVHDSAWHPCGSDKSPRLATQPALYGNSTATEEARKTKKPAVANLLALVYLGSPTWTRTRDLRINRHRLSPANFIPAPWWVRWRVQRR